jgi:hypothetical protein
VCGFVEEWEEEEEDRGTLLYASPDVEYDDLEMM